MRLIIILFIILIVPFVLSTDCKEGEKYSFSKGGCVSICTVAQDYVNGDCLPKCRDLEYHLWDVELERCVHMCEDNPSHYFCDNKKEDIQKQIDKSCSSGKDLCKGTVISLSGKMTIERGLDIFNAKISDELFPGDIIVVDEGSIVTIKLHNDKIITISKKTKFSIPNTEKAEKKISKVNLFFGKLFLKLKNYFGKEDIKKETPTAVAGVRG